jgi:hypothetical protein
VASGQVSDARTNRPATEIQAARHRAGTTTAPCARCCGAGSETRDQPAPDLLLLDGGKGSATPARRCSRTWRQGIALAFAKERDEVADARVLRQCAEARLLLPGKDPILFTTTTGRRCAQVRR